MANGRTATGSGQQAAGKWQRVNGKRQRWQKHLLARACAMGDGLVGGSRWRPA